MYTPSNTQCIYHNTFQTILHYMRMYAHIQMYTIVGFTKIYTVSSHTRTRTDYQVQTHTHPHTHTQY